MSVYFRSQGTLCVIDEVALCVVREEVVYVLDEDANSLSKVINFYEKIIICWKKVIYVLNEVVRALFCQADHTDNTLLAQKLAHYIFPDRYLR